MFSIIATDYENYVNRDRVKEGLQCLSNQISKDFELIIVHDGPKKIPYEQEFNMKDLNIEYKVLSTDKFYGISEDRKFGWGHHSRKLGIENAGREYIINFNIDNLLHPTAIKVLKSTAIKNNFPDVMIFAIDYPGWNSYFSGLPPRPGAVDLLQCVAKKSKWDEIGGFYKFNVEADGELIEELIEKFGFMHIKSVLGVQR